MNKAMHTRVRALESRLGVPDGPEPTLFVEVTDDGIPDPDSDPEQTSPDLDWLATRKSGNVAGLVASDSPKMDSAATGYMGSGIQVTRLKNEPLADLQARCRDQHPQVRVWFEMHPGVNA
jgi:hypothetical protein